MLRIVRPLTRCVMIDVVQDQAGERNDLLEVLAGYHVMTSGAIAAVGQPGRVAAGDVCSRACGRRPGRGDEADRQRRRAVTAQRPRARAF